MKKWIALFKESYEEFRYFKIRTIATCAMFGCISVVLGGLTLELGPYLKLGVSTIPNQLVYYLLGPAVGCFFGGALDILKYFLKPTGPYFPGFTLDAALAGVLYGCFFYRKPIKFRRVLAAEFTVSVICNVLLGTLWLSVMSGKGFMVLLPGRLLKNLVMWPVYSGLFFVCVEYVKESKRFQSMWTSMGRRISTE